MVEIYNRLYASDNTSVMLEMPGKCVDLVIFSPPYYKQRKYGRGSEEQIGQEKTPKEFVNNLANICDIIKDVLKSTGSMYIVIGDKYEKKNLLGTPWKLAIELQDRNWILRNDIIWYKPNAMPQSVKDRLKSTYEHVFHFVKNYKYYYNLDMIREPHIWANKDKRSKRRRVAHKSGKSIQPGSEFGMAAVGYHPLGKNPGDIYKGKFSEDPEAVGSPRARTARKGYNAKDHFYHEKGKNPGDFQTVNTGGYKGAHFAVFPPELLVRPIISSTPPDGLVMDPFVGSGTVPFTCELINNRKWKELRYSPNKSAEDTKWNLKWLGIDIVPEYIKLAEDRIRKTY